MEGFTYLLPLQEHFVRKCLDGGARLVFVHPSDADQPDGFAVMERTYAPYAGHGTREELVTPVDAEGPDLRLLQGGLFADRPAGAPAGDGSVTLAAYAHRHREVAACLDRVRQYLGKPEDGGTGLPAKGIAIVTRNGGEFVTVLQEEARRLGVLERLRIEPRLLLLTPLGRFALTLYDLNATGRFELTPDRFEMMIASGWLGAAVQHTVDLFAAVRPQALDRCRSVADWERAFAQLAAADRAAPELARLPGTGVGDTQLGAWRKALKQVCDLHARLFDNRPRSIAEHIRRLRDELSRLNPDDMRKDERDLMERILEALEVVVGAALVVDDREMSDLLVGMARGEHGAEDDPPIDPAKVWVTTPEGIDSAPRDVVFYLGVDSARVPRPSGMPWPFFAPTADADADRERYLFLTVVRAARRRLHLSYSKEGEGETYGASPYLTAAARLLKREADLTLPAPPPPAVVPAPHAPPVLAGQAGEYDLHDVATFGLCPYRFRLEQFDAFARRFRDKFQLRFQAQGVWLERVFERMVGSGTFRDAETLRRAIHAAAKAERPCVHALFAALGPLDWEGIRRYLKSAFRDFVDCWLAQPEHRHSPPLERGVTFEQAPPGVQYEFDLDGRTVVVRTWLRHVLRVGNRLRPLPDALTHLHWLLPAYRGEARSGTGGSGMGAVRIDGIEVFGALDVAIRWWRGMFRAALRKADYAEQYAANQRELAGRIRAMQAGRFPKHPGDHCELCPVRHACLGAPELGGPAV
jgi:hypothetical protein